MDTEVLHKMTTKDFVVQIVPRWADMDLNQHMRHSAFADWASYARTEWLHTNGFTMEKLAELKITPIMFEDRTRFLKEVLLGDRIHKLQCRDTVLCFDESPADSGKNADVRRQRGGRPSIG